MDENVLTLRGILAKDSSSTATLFVQGLLASDENCRRTAEKTIDKLLASFGKEAHAACVVQWCRALAAGGKPYSDFKEAVKSYDATEFCGLVWNADFIAYRCRTCEKSSCMSLCAACFRNADHEGHDFNMFRSYAGGACDCGDSSVMDPKGFCESHRPGLPKKPIPEELVILPKLLIPRLIHKVLDILRTRLPSPKVVHPPPLPEDALIKFLIDMSGAGAPIRSIMAEALMDTDSYRPYGMSEDEAASDENVGKYSFETPAPNPAVTCSVVKNADAALIQSNGADPTSPMEEILLAAQYFRYPLELTTWLLQLLADTTFKDAFADVFVRHYGRCVPLLSEDTQSSERRAVANRHIHLSVQLFSSADLACRLVTAVSEKEKMHQEPSEETLRLMGRSGLPDDDELRHKEGRLRCSMTELAGHVQQIQGMMQQLHDLEASLVTETDALGQPTDAAAARSAASALHAISQSVDSGAEAIAFAGVTAEPVSTEEPSGSGVGAEGMDWEDTDSEAKGVWTSSTAEIGPSSLSQKEVGTGKLLERVILSLQSMLESQLVHSRYGNQEILNCRRQAMKDQFFWAPLSDFANLLGHEPVAKHFMSQPHLLRMWCNTLKFINRMNPSEKMIRDHIGYESDAYTVAYTAEYEFSCTVMWKLLQHAGAFKPYEVVDFLRALRHTIGDCVRNANFEEMVMCARLDNAQAVGILGTLSFHLPLHRNFAALVMHALRAGIVGIDLCFPDGWEQSPAIVDVEFLAKLMVHPLQIQAGCTEIFCDMWVRNGFHMKNQAYSYALYHSCYSLVDLDIYLLQLCACHLPSDRFLRRVIDMFSVSSWLLLKRSLNRRNNSSTPPGTPNAAQEEALLEGFLSLIGQIVTARIHTGVSEDPTAGMFRRELVVQLSVQDQTYSSLVIGLPPEKSAALHDQTPNLQAMLKETANYKAPSVDSSGKLLQGVYALKDEVWEKEFDPMHTLQRTAHVRTREKQDYQRALQRFTDFAKRTGRCAPDITPWPRYKLPLQLAEPYKNLDKLLFSKTFLGIMFAVLHRAEYGSMVKRRVSDDALCTAFHLITLSSFYAVIRKREYEAAAMETGSEGSADYVKTESFYSCPDPSESDGAYNRWFPHSGYFDNFIHTVETVCDPPEDEDRLGADQDHDMIYSNSYDRLRISLNLRRRHFARRSSPPSGSASSGSSSATGTPGPSSASSTSTPTVASESLLSLLVKLHHKMALSDRKPNSAGPVFSDKSPFSSPQSPTDSTSSAAGNPSTTAATSPRDLGPHSSFDYMFPTSSSSPAPSTASPETENLSAIFERELSSVGTGAESVARLLDFLYRGSSECANELERLCRPSLVVESIDGPKGQQSKDDVRAGGEGDPQLERKRKTEERKKRMMEKMARQQKKFIDSNPSAHTPGTSAQIHAPSGGPSPPEPTTERTLTTEDTGHPAERSCHRRNVPTPEGLPAVERVAPSYECGICGETTPSLLKNPMGVVAYVHDSGVIGSQYVEVCEFDHQLSPHRVPRHLRPVLADRSAGSGCPACSSASAACPGMVVTDGQTWKSFTERTGAGRQVMAQTSNAELIGCFHGRAPIVVACGHYLHLSCLTSHRKYNENERRYYKHFSKGEFSCPMCRQVCNSIIPVQAADQESFEVDEGASSRMITKHQRASKSRYFQGLEQFFRVLCKHSEASKEDLEQMDLIVYLQAVARSNVEYDSLCTTLKLSTPIRKTGLRHLLSAINSFTRTLILIETLTSQSEKYYRSETRLHRVLMSQPGNETARSASKGPAPGPISMFHAERAAQQRMKDRNRRKLTRLTERLVAGGLLPVSPERLPGKSGHARFGADSNNEDDECDDEDADAELDESSDVCLKYHYRVPFLFRDAELILSQFVLENALTIENYREFAQLAYNVEYCRVLLRLTCKVSDSELEAWSGIKGQKPPTCVQELGPIVRCLSKTEFYIVKEEEQLFLTSMCSFQTVLDFLLKGCLPFVKFAASLKSCLFELDLPSIDDKESEEVRFCKLCNFIGLPYGESGAEKSPTVLKGSDAAMSAVQWEGLDNGRVSINDTLGAWLRGITHQIHTNCSSTKEFFELKGYTIHPPRLLPLPSEYDALFEHYRQVCCAGCGVAPQTPGLCLVCGTVVSFKTACGCARGEIAHRHARECGAGTGVFLNIHGCYVLILRGSKVAIWGSLYLDLHGEEDRDLKRGRTLYLSQARYKALEEQFIAHNFDATCKRWGFHKGEL